MNVVGAEFAFRCPFVNQFSSVTQAYGHHREKPWRIPWNVPLRNPGDSRRTLNQTMFWKRLWEGGAPRRATLPVSLVESDAWSRAAPGKMGHDVCDAVGDLCWANQTTQSYSHGERFLAERRREPQSKEFGGRDMISVGFIGIFYLPPAWRAFFRASEKEIGWEQVGVAMRPLKSVFFTGKSTSLQESP